ncbi:MAG: hypothetical protein IK066_07855 [Kiritimatiellae bacterium]|nr:hypothetical protein [Kiritimatiellia bacterium]
MTETAPAIGLFEAKTHFSRIVDDLVNGRSGAVPVMRRGKPAVYIVTDAFFRQAAAGAPGIRYGLAKGKYRLARDIDAGNAEVLQLFRGGEP